MRIAIDAHMVGTRETGNETYVVNLSKALASVDTINQYRLYTHDPTSLPAELLRPSNFSALRVRPGLSAIRIPLSMPYLSWKDNHDLLHVNYIAPPVSPCPTVVTIHDISYEFFPEFFSARDRMLLSTLVPLSARRASRIIAASQSTKRDIVERYDVDPERISVTYYAADSQFRPISNRGALRAVLDDYGISQGFILTVGNLQPRKNLLRLVEAFAELIQSRAIDPQLVIAGQAFWRGSEVSRRVEERHLHEHVVFTGYVPQEHLVSLYNAADLFVYPSLYEGFGLPLLEAMACGTPVITSNRSSLPEVVGEAALLVEPHRTEDLAQAILDVLSNDALQSELSAKGLERAGFFSWERTAKQTLAVYEEVLDRTAESGQAHPRDHTATRE
jgi:glycosyltransferase involved in cell wall biosynthesis